jgi:hypothetical protein
MRENINVYRVSVGKPEGKRSLGRPRCRWVNNITIELREIEWGGMDWIGLAQYRYRWRTLLKMVTNLQVP